MYWQQLCSKNNFHLNSDMDNRSILLLFIIYYYHLDVLQVDTFHFEPAAQMQLYEEGRSVRVLVILFDVSICEELSDSRLL